MTENKRFEVILNEFDEVEYIMDKEMMENRDFAEFIDFVEEVCNETKQLKKENRQLREIVKLSYYNEICEHCKYGHYFGSGGHLEYNEFDFECKKKHFGKDHWKCDNLKECEDFELNDLNKLLEDLE